MRSNNSNTKKNMDHKSKANLKTLASVVILVLLVLILFTLPRLLTNLMNLQKNLNTSAVGNPKLCLKSCTGTNPATDVATVNTPYSVSVILDTDQINIRGVDAVITYDKNLLQLTDINPAAIAGTTLKQFAPVIPNDPVGTFDKNKVMTCANSGCVAPDPIVSAGTIKFGASTFQWYPSPTPGVITNAFNGSTTLAILTFLPKASGSTSINFGFTPGSTTDSNVVPDNANQDSLSSVVNLNLTISGGAPSPLPSGTGNACNLDCSADNLVGIFDYNVLLQYFGKAGVNASCGTNPDFNATGTVDIFDYSKLLQNFGKTTCN